MFGHQSLVLHPRKLKEEMDIENFWDFTNPFVEFWQSIFHLPDDMMRLAICLIATYPAVMIHRYLLTGTKQRLLFGVAFAS